MARTADPAPPPADPAAVEARTQQLGRELLAAAARYRPGPAERVEDWLLTHAVAEERFRGRLLRYMDVLAALDHDAGGHEAKRLAREYFGDAFPDLPFALRWLLRVARDPLLPAPVVGVTARRSVELFARRFITLPAPDAVRATADQLAALGRSPSFDLLGEAVLSAAEAQAYVDRYLALLVQLATHPAAGTRTASGNATLQISLKLSSLTAHFSPVDPAGTVRRVRPALEAIVEAAARARVGLTVDMEQYAYRDLTWELFTHVFGRGARFADWPDAGIVLQAYLRDAETHAHQLVAFARARGMPFQVRLVKGAYWDYETIVAAANRWPAPVWSAKAATDASFERTLAILVAAHPALRIAVGSHNARAHAHAEALAAVHGLPPRTLEHQVLFRTAEGTSRGLAALGWDVRDYVPVGEPLPGMAYLVRRVLENSSQAGFLLQSRSGATPDELLRAPRPVDDAPPGPLAPPRGERGPGGEGSREARAPAGEGSVDFPRAAEARWHDAAFREAFEATLASTRARWGERFELPPALAAGSELVAVFSPSHPDGPPVGHAAFATGEAARRLAAELRAGAPHWAGAPVAERTRALRRAADLLYERAHEFAAWLVHEGGRDRADAWAEVVEAVDALQYYAQRAEALFAAHGDTVTPRGVVAVIPPWNFSLAIPCAMTAAALVTGNAAILKPAAQTPLVAHRLVALLHEAGVSTDVLACLPGRGADAGQALADSPDVAMVAFTGSHAVGTHLHESVAHVDPADAPLKALVAELGGKNPVLVFADADLDEAVDGILRSAFGHANQKCSAASRVLVAAPLFEHLRDRLIDAAQSIEVGPADAPATRVNPLIDRPAWERLQRAAATAREQCTVLLDRFAGRPGTLEAGPLIMQLSADRALSATTATEELFGPILVLIPFTDEAEAYAIANGTGYALTAGVFSRSPRTIERATHALDAGNIYVNRTITGARIGVEPFGGHHRSGTGPKAGGPDYLWAFLRRTDAPADDAAAHALVAAAEARAAEQSHAHAVVLDVLADRWDAPLHARIDTVERAAVLLAEEHHAHVAPLYAAAQAARRELARPVPTPQAAGQHTELRYDIARGLGILRADGDHAVGWLAAALLAGNAMAVFDSPDLAPTVEALLAAGVPPDVLATGGDLAALLAAAHAPRVSFAATDSGPALARALYRRLGPTPPGQRDLKALLSALDGPQPGEPGFLHRFAWPRVVAVRTLRHGADLALAAPPDARAIARG
ncbi:MAG: aldehyde dehydrogenase family protein [Dehalococcoidia bacterium]|nr:aldehyde dehydrogenase family protein [Dehalococcoidia bacterium]